MNLTVIDLLVIASLVWSPNLVRYYFSEKKRKLTVISQGQWIENNGKRPALFNVDVVYSNGNLRERVSAKTLCWDKYSSDNPIVRYRKAETRIDNSFFS